MNDTRFLMHKKRLTISLRICIMIHHITLLFVINIRKLCESDRTITTTSSYCQTLTKHACSSKHGSMFQFIYYLVTVSTVVEVCA